MKKYLLGLLVLMSPFIIMILVNESFRYKNNEEQYSAFGITAINSNNYTPDKCTWVCHNNTNYCKEHHVKYLKNYFAYSDKLYFGIIGLLASTGNYGLANIIFLVILIPLYIWFLLI